jgi:drug/metabolite transporter (DMT)-like permease
MWLVYGAYIGVVIIWSTTPLAIKWSSEGAGFLFGVSSRMAIGTLLAFALTLLIYKRLAVFRGAVLTYCAAAVGIYGGMISIYWGSQFIPSGLISVLYGLSPMIMSALALAYLGERGLSVMRVVAMCIGLCGLMLVFRQQIEVGENAALGVVAVLLSVTVNCSSAVSIKRINAKLPALMVTSGGLLFALPAFLLTAYIGEDALPAALPERARWSILYLGIMGSVVGFVLYYFVLARLTAAQVALITLITPVTALWLGCWLNHEQISALAWYGVACILISLIVYQWGGRIA